MVKIFANQFKVIFGRYIFDPKGGKKHTGAFVPEKNLPCLALNPPITLVYKADEIYHHYKGDDRDFELNLLVDGKPVCEPIKGFMTESGPNEDYEDKVREMLGVAKKYYKENFLGHNGDNDN